MELYRGLLVAWACSFFPGYSDAFNIDTKHPQIIPGSKEAYFGYTVQQLEINDTKWLLVGAPLEMNGQQKTGDVYKCQVTNETTSNCSKLNLGRRILAGVSERKDNMRLGMSLTTNPKDNSFVACSPLWSHECGTSYYTTGMCFRVNANFRFSKAVTPALQRCQTYMDIVIVLDGSNSIYPWVEVRDFLTSILKKFYIGPGQIQVGVVQYGERVVHEFNLSSYRSVKEVVHAAYHIEQRGGTETNTALGIEIACSEAFRKGGRKGAKKVLIVITDGESHDSENLQKVIEDAEKENITRYAVAVLGYYNRRGINPEAFLNEIRYIASDPDDKHFFNVTDEAALKDIVDALGERIFSLEGGTNKNEAAFGLEMSQTGFSSHFVEDGIILGAVGAYDWNGAVLKETSSGKIIPRRESYLQEFPEELKNHGAYLGYTVTSVMSAKSGRIYVAGAPRFNHTGKVIIFTMHNNEKLTIHQSLKGEQIGAYYGSTIDSVDVNGDGITDVLLVAAPMYFSEGRERGRVYVYHLRESLDVQPGQGQICLAEPTNPEMFRIKVGFVSDGSLKDMDSSQNSRFGSSIAAVPDLNQDSYNDVVVGAPLEEDHKGAIYIFHGFKRNILKKCKQRIAASDLAPGLQYFGCSIHGELDMNEDGLVDLAVGSLGNAVLLWTRSVVQINVSIKFEPSKINIFTKDCRRNGKEATCMAGFLCFTPIFRSPLFQDQPVAITYNTTIDERRYTPRAILDENGDKYTQRNIVTRAGEMHCDQLNFHVLDTADYVKPITFFLEYGLRYPDDGPTLDFGWPTKLRVSVPFWNGCNEDEHCVPDLVLDGRSDILSAMAFCRQVLKRSPAECSAYTLSFDTSVFIIESSRRRVAMEVTLENRGENAYNTILNISFSRNLHFSSLILKEDTDVKIECTNEDRLASTKVCNVSYPFFRAKAKVTFRLDFEFSKSYFLPRMKILLTANSDSEELVATRHDNSMLLDFLLKYESDLLFHRICSLDRYEIKPDSSLDRYDSIGPPFNCTFQIQNLGFFPVNDLTIKILIPVATRGGNRVLFLKDFLIDQKNVTYNIWGNKTDYRHSPSEEDLTHHPQLNHSNADVLSIECNMRVDSSEEINIHLYGNLWMKSFKTLKFRSLKLVISAALQRRFHSPFIFREEQLSRQITLEISKQEAWEIPVWIIIGSTLGGLLLLALLVLALWKNSCPQMNPERIQRETRESPQTQQLGFFKRSTPRHVDEQDSNGKALE